MCNLSKQNRLKLTVGARTLRVRKVANLQVVKTAINKERENVKPITVTTLGVTTMTTHLGAKVNTPVKVKVVLKPNRERENPLLVTRESLKAPNEATTTRNPTQNAKKLLSNDDAKNN